MKDLEIDFYDKDKHRYGAFVIDGKDREKVKTVLMDASKKFNGHREYGQRWPKKDELVSMQFNGKEMDLSLFKDQKFDELVEIVLTV